MFIACISFALLFLSFPLFSPYSCKELQGSKEFSELRKIKEFQLPQTILFYSDILTFFVPIMLCPNFAHIGIKWDNIWSPYYEAVKIVILFEMFQICQDYFINPFANASDM